MSDYNYNNYNLSKAFNNVLACKEKMKGLMESLKKIYKM